MTDSPTERDEGVGWAKLRRRKVVQWSLAYAAAAWALLQVFGFAADSFGWPVIAKQLAMLASALGLPIVVVLAWYHGDRGRQRVSPSEVAVLAALFLLGGTAVFWWGWQRVEPPQTGASAAGPGSGSQSAMAVSADSNSIAVLPFVNMTSDPEQQYFSDGMSEQILDLLAKVPELRVIARTSSFAFRGKDDDVGAIAKRLNVAHVLDGSVRKSGQRVRITAQLINAANRSQVWGETYDRELTDVFAIQDEIALAVVAQLKVKLLGGKLAARSTTKSTEAYARYLQARWLLDQQGAESMRRSYDLLQEAVALDPNYADAWALLGMVCGYLGNYGVTPLAVARAERDSAVQKALSLDPMNVGALLQTGAPKDFATALSLEPGNVHVINAGALGAYVDGQLDEAVRLFKRSLELDPLRPTTYRGLATALLSAGDAGGAEAAMRTAVQLNPDMIAGYYWLGRAQLAAGRPDAALESMRREKGDLYRLTGLAVVNHALGRSAESEAALQKVMVEYGDPAAYQIAEVHAFRGELDAAFKWLDRACELRDPGIAFIRLDVRQAGVRQDPRFPGLVKKVFPPEE